MNLFRKNFKTPTRLLFTILFLQILLVPTANATDVSINGSTNLVRVSINGSEPLELMDEIIYNYQSISGNPTTPRSIGFNIASPFVCSKPFVDPIATTVLNVNTSILQGNQILSAVLDSNFVFRVNTDENIQCASASALGIYNDVLFSQGFDSSLDIEILLKDSDGNRILSINDIELFNGQLFEYKYEIINHSSSDVAVDILESYLDASPTFDSNYIDDGWVCFAGATSRCGSGDGEGNVSLKNARIGANEQLDVVVTRKVNVEQSGPDIKLDLLAAVFLKNNVFDSFQDNNIAYAPLGTKTITGTKLNITSQHDSDANFVSGEELSDIDVEVVDSDGNLDYSYTGIVKVTIDGNPPGVNLIDSITEVALVNGKATFSGLKIDKAGNLYKLLVSYIETFGGPAALTGAKSKRFNITPGNATHLIVVNQPSGAVAQTTMAPIIVEARDDNNNVDTSYDGRVNANIKSGQGTLSGTNPFANSGEAIFNDLSIDLAGTGYTLVFSSGILQGAISDLFDITAIPSVANSVFYLNTGIQTAGSIVTLGATISDGSNNPVGSGVSVSFSMDNSADVNAPDVECVTDSNGECTISVSSTIVGNTIVSASISAGVIALGVNPNNGVNTDTITWIAGIADATNSNFGAQHETTAINTSVALEAELRDQYGNLVPDETVSFEFTNNGASTPPGAFCNTVTNANGVCNSSVQSSATGTTTVRAFFGNPSTEIVNTDNYNGLGKTIIWTAPN